MRSSVQPASPVLLFAIDSSAWDLDSLSLQLFITLKYLDHHDTPPAGSRKNKRVVLSQNLLSS